MFGHLLPYSILLRCYRTLRLNRIRPKTLVPSRIKPGGIGIALISTPNKPAPASVVPSGVPKTLTKYVSPDVAKKVKLSVPLGSTIVPTVSVAVVREKKRNVNPKYGSTLKSERVAV